MCLICPKLRVIIDLVTETRAKLDSSPKTKTVKLIWIHIFCYCSVQYKSIYLSIVNYV